MESRRLSKKFIIQQTSAHLINENNFIAIVANGEFTKSKLIINLLKKSKLIIACDGAAHELNKRDIIPDYVIGDNDSLIQNHEAKNPYIYINDQNTKDLTKAFNFAINQQEIKKLPILFFNANGNREDHFIGNFALLNEFGKQHNDICMISDFGIFKYYSTGKHEIKCLQNQQISLFNLEANNKISTDGLVWNLDNSSIDNLFMATLNQTLSNNYEIRSSKAIIIYTSFECK
jgi:thiamine pyrophosphokinase